MYDEPNESHNNTIETGYIEPIERGIDSTKVKYLTHIDGNGGNTADAAYCEPADFDNDSADSTYLEIIDGSNNLAYSHSEPFSLAGTDHSEPFDLDEAGHSDPTTEAGYTELTDLAEAGYTEPTDLAEPGYLEIVDSDNHYDSAEAAQHLIAGEDSYEDLDVAADGDSANPAYGGQAQVASNDSVFQARDNIGNEVKLTQLHILSLL